MRYGTTVAAASMLAFVTTAVSAQPRTARLFVSAENAAGIAVRNLAVTDFIVKENGARCEVVSARRADVQSTSSL